MTLYKLPFLQCFFTNIVKINEEIISNNIRVNEFINSNIFNGYIKGDRISERVELSKYITKVSEEKIYTDKYANMFKGFDPNFKIVLNNKDTLSLSSEEVSISKYEEIMKDRIIKAYSNDNVEVKMKSDINIQQQIKSGEGIKSNIEDLDNWQDEFNLEEPDDDIGIFSSKHGYDLSFKDMPDNIRDLLINKANTDSKVNIVKDVVNYDTIIKSDNKEEIINVIPISIVKEEIKKN